MSLNLYPPVKKSLAACVLRFVIHIHVFPLGEHPEIHVNLTFSMVL